MAPDFLGPEYEEWPIPTACGALDTGPAGLLEHLEHAAPTHHLWGSSTFLPGGPTDLADTPCIESEFAFSSPCSPPGLGSYLASRVRRKTQQPRYLNAIQLLCCALRVDEDNTIQHNTRSIRETEEVCFPCRRRLPSCRLCLAAPDSSPPNSRPIRRPSTR